MKALELKVPPVALGLACAAAMWTLAAAWPTAALRFPGQRLLAVGLVLLGAAVAVAGVVAFRRARTTVDPTNPGKTSALVRSGVYRITRNPMYVGFALALLGEAAWFGQPSAVALVAAFVLWIDRLQIVPEERVLAARFGTEFDAYRAAVRRWL